MVNFVDREREYGRLHQLQMAEQERDELLNQIKKFKEDDVEREKQRREQQK